LRNGFAADLEVKVKKSDYIGYLGDLRRSRRSRRSRRCRRGRNYLGLHQGPCSSQARLGYRPAVMLARYQLLLLLFENHVTPCIDGRISKKKKAAEILNLQLETRRIKPV